MNCVKKITIYFLNWFKNGGMFLWACEGYQSNRFKIGHSSHFEKILREKIEFTRYKRYTGKYNNEKSED